MQPIKKENLNGHYVTYVETVTQGGKFRTEKVTKVIGRTITVVNCLGRRRRINLDNIKGCIHHKNKLRAVV